MVYWVLLPEHVNDAESDFFFMQFAVFLALAIAVFFALAIGSWWRREYQDQNFYYLLCAITLYIAEAVIVGLFVFAASASILGSIELLFDLGRTNEDPYLFLWVFSCLFLAPLFFLARFPRTLPESLDVSERFLSFVIRFIAVPFTYMYFVILYAYSIKVLMNFSQWPEGVVSWLVIGCSIFGYIVYLLSYYLKDDAWVARFRKSFPILLIPQLGMLFYAISLRIGQYGWTINRYLVVAFGVWLLGLSLYYGIWQKRSRLIILPTSIFACILLTQFGPWSIYEVSKSSQIQRIEQFATSAKLTAKQAKKATSSVRYICSYHGCKTLQDSEYLKLRLDDNSKEFWQINEILFDGSIENGIARHDLMQRYLHDDSTEPYNVRGMDKFEPFGSEFGNSIRHVYFDTEQQKLIIDEQVVDISSQLKEIISNVDGNVLQLREFEIELSHQNPPELKTLEVKGLVKRKYRLFIDTIRLVNGRYEQLSGKIAY